MPSNTPLAELYRTMRRIRTFEERLLDNSTERVDVGSKAERYALVRNLAQQGATVLIASAEFPELIALCDRVYCIADNRLAACLTRAELSESRLLFEVN